MQRKMISFTGVRQVELTESSLGKVGDDEALIANEISAISSGTERACLLDLPNLADSPTGQFPKSLGYSGVGRVLEAGQNIRSVQVGDRVLTHWGSFHSDYNLIKEEHLMKIENSALASEHAVFAVIAGFSMNGLRKTRLEIGESASVIGMGILGVFALALCRIAGASPVIAADLNAERRRLAIDLGAHHAFDPLEADYVEKVKAVSRGGVNAVVEVTGQSVALKQALAFMAPAGRISLLGCTRVSDTVIDYYQEVHRPGIEIIGAHTNARPKWESRAHSWTWKDDARALMDFMADGRLDMTRILSAAYKPEDAPTVYQALADDPHFPVGAVFDWRN
ncbi:zinc-binding alcohol dehydrogenase [Kiritimatiellaeota bacterium B1221]|nr:zinc-binding alcohol dehydrogenase [Kiritimatiellaeota bacterium B1221]